MMKNHKIYFRLFFMLILSLCVSFESFGIEETGEIKWPEIKK